MPISSRSPRDQRGRGSRAQSFRGSSHPRSSSASAGRTRATSERGYSSNRSRFGASASNRSNGRGRSRKTPAPIDISRFINESPATPQKPEVYEAIHTFADFALIPALSQAITTKGYDIPTPIQDKAIPHVLRGRDVVGLANTGSGKTAAFLIPLIQKVLLVPNEQILVLAPTRELALQIEEEFAGFAKTLKLQSVVCVGGVPIGPQLRKLRSHNHLIVGTPGRVIDLIERRALNLSRTNTVVLDEADRMLDMGFINDMRKIMAQMPTKRQTLFFSATLSPEIEKLIHDFLHEPVSVSVKTRSTSQNIKQEVIRVNGRDKIELLIDLLKQRGYDKVIIFGRTKHGVEKLSQILQKRGVRSDSIHGNKTHNQRQRSLNAFKAHKLQALVATDVAARGLDIPDVSHVINFELPGTHDDYVHRIGRTGRADKLGSALTFVD